MCKVHNSIAVYAAVVSFIIIVTSSSSYSKSSEIKARIRKFGGFLEMASARALRLPSVASRVFRTEVGTGFRNAPERKVYQNNSECKYEDVRSGDLEYV